MLEFLRGIRDESVLNLRRLDTTESSKVLRSHATSFKVQLNLSSMLLELPAVIKEASEQIEQKQAYAARYEAAQESGMIGKAGSSQKIKSREAM